MGEVHQRGKKMDSRKQPTIPRKRLEAKWSKRDRQPLMGHRVLRSRIIPAKKTRPEAA